MGRIYICMIGVFHLTSVMCQQPRLYTVHLTPKTWNEARDICGDNGGNLLTILTDVEWNMWIRLLNTTNHPRSPAEKAYWFGLYGYRPDNEEILTNTMSYIWDPCVQPNYTEPLADEIPNSYLCVLMWVRREIFLGVFVDGWFKGKQCDGAYPFICTRPDHDVSCVPSCDVIMVTVNVTTCEEWCTTGDCETEYIQQTQQCYIRPTTFSSDSVYTVCVLPDVEYTRCTTTPSHLVVPYADYSDPNVNITRTLCNPVTTSPGLQPTVTQTIVISPTPSMPATFTTTTTPTAIQTMTSAVDVQTTPNMCMCSCEKLQTFMAIPEPEVVNLTIEEKVEIIVAELTVDKKNTTVSQRRYISVMDDRPTSVGIGSVAAGIILGVIGIIVVIDLSRIWHEIKYILIKIKFFLKGYKIGHKDPLATLAKSTSKFNVLLAAPNYANKSKNGEKSGKPPRKKSRIETDLEMLFTCMKVPKDTPTAPSDTKIPTIVISSETTNELGQMDSITKSHGKISMDQLSMYDITNDDTSDIHMDMNKYIDETRKGEDNSATTEHDAGTGDHDCGNTHREKRGVAMHTNMSGNSPRFYRWNKTTPRAFKPEWRYW